MKKFLPLVIVLFAILFGIYSSLNKKFERLSEPIFNNDNY